MAPWKSLLFYRVVLSDYFHFCLPNYLHYLKETDNKVGEPMTRQAVWVHCGFIWLISVGAASSISQGVKMLSINGKQNE